MTKFGAVRSHDSIGRRVVPLSFKKGNAHRDGPYVLTVTSGKGGVGKTLTTVNLAVALQRLGLKTMILDGDLGLANVDVVLGLQAKATLHDVIEGDSAFSEIILDGPSGVRIIPSGSGFRNLTKLSGAQRLRLAAELENLEEPIDILIIDTGAGISDNVIYLNSIAHDCLVITTPEPHALTDAYAIIKVMAEDHERKQVDLLVNMVRSPDEGLKIHGRLAEVAGRFLNVEVRNAGSVPEDPQTRKAVVMRRAASEASLHTLSGQAWLKLAREFSTRVLAHAGSANAAVAFRRLLWSNESSRPSLD